MKTETTDDRTDPLLLEAELQAIEIEVGEPEKRELLAKRLANEGMLLDDLLVLIAYAKRRSTSPGQFSGLVWTIISRPGARWRDYVRDLRAAKRAPEAPASAEGADAGRGRGPLCRHGRYPVAEGCDSCQFTPGISTTRSGCWNRITRSFNPGEPDGPDWEALNRKPKRRPKDTAAADDQRRRAEVRALAGTATDAQRREVGPRGPSVEREPGSDDDLED